MTWDKLRGNFAEASVVALVALVLIWLLWGDKLRDAAGKFLGPRGLQWPSLDWGADAPREPNAYPTPSADGGVTGACSPCADKTYSYTFGSAQDQAAWFGNHATMGATNG